MTERADYDDRFDFGAFRAFFSHWKSGIFTAVICGGALAAYVFAMTPMYRSHLQILLPASSLEDPSDRKSVSANQADVVVLRSYDEMVADEGVADAVIAALRLETSPEFNRPPSFFQRLIDALRQRLAPEDDASVFTKAQLKHDAVLNQYEARLKAKNETKSLVLGLSFDATDPLLAKRILDAHADAFVKSQIERRRRIFESKAEWMKVELQKAASDVRTEQTSLQLRPASTGMSRENAADHAAELRFRQLMINSKQAVYESLLARYQNIVAEQRYDGSDIAILSPASVPTRAAFPKKTLMLPAAAAIGLICGIAVAFVRAKSWTSLNAREICKDLGLPVLATVNFPAKRRWYQIPYLRDLKLALFWEQIAELRTFLSVPAHARPPYSAPLRQDSARGRAIAVASAMSGEGKSLVATALAHALASSGSKTLLLDLDTKRRSRPSPLANSSVSLQDVLAGTVDLKDAAIAAEDGLPLCVLTHQGDAPIDIAALTGARLAALLDAARHAFDTIIVDTASLNGVSDTLCLASLVDEMILAAALAQEERGTLQACVKRLWARGAVVTGVVVTDPARPRAAAIRRMKPYLGCQRTDFGWATMKGAESGSWTRDQLVLSHVKL